MTGSKATDLSDITTDNIIKPTLKDLSEEQRRILGEWKKKRREEIETLHREKERLPMWEGPFRVTRIARLGAARLEAEDRTPVANPWNIKHLRKFYP